MLIGELARRSGTSVRLLRYYERVGLLGSQRRSNGYREYGADAEQTVRKIRMLLDAGLPTRTIRHIIDCANPDGSLTACPGVLDLLRARLSELDRQAADLASTRSVLASTIDALSPRHAPA
ncbi:MerR family transcriptional regulator [Amycolatopsis acidicola]|uniref:MerR family transcriptional regulator n=1 Tax=Amycolatopsis acidicola TaxID=2596893 RepID=A0A5N0UTW0_9PSEU|nr:MerR family transcriptional regulator [Amycolatopsis acidicola]KAA9151753.1 MerR family transcriptional regulator [Amycolatopsis acidicola]